MVSGTDRLLATTPAVESPMAFVDTCPFVEGMRLEDVLNGLLIDVQWVLNVWLLHVLCLFDTKILGD